MIKGQALDLSTSQTLDQLGKVLRSLRERRGLSQANMESMGLSHRYYHRVENGKANVTIKTLVKIADSLGVEIEDIFKRMLCQEDGPEGKTGDHKRRVAVVQKITKGKS